MATTGHSRQSEAAQQTAEALALYDRYARPLEEKHDGQYVAISNDGKVIIGDDLLAIVREASQELGPGSYVFKVGEVAVDTWLCLTLSQ
jgi:hypothetical protein